MHKLISIILTLVFILLLSGCTPSDPLPDDLYIGGTLYVWDGAAWVAVVGSGSGDVTAAANLDNNTVIRGDGGAKGVQDSGVTVDDFDNLDTNGGDLTGFDINAGNDVNVTNNLDVTDDAGIGGILTMGDQISMGANKIDNAKLINVTDATELTINAGAITVTQGWHTVDTEGDAATDDLVTINGGTTGDIIYLSAANDAREIRIARTGNIRFQPEHLVEGSSFVSPSGASGTFYALGFYTAPAADANLTQASPTVTIGSANTPHAAHIFIVAKQAGTTDAGTVSIVVSGVSIDSDGVRNAADTETLVADITAMTPNKYYETTKRWLGIDTITLTGAGGATTYAADFNYGKSVYDSFDERHSTIKKIEIFGREGANDTGINIELLKHTTTGWVYSAAAFIPNATPVYSLVTDYATDNDLVANERFYWDREALVNIDPDAGEGYLYRITTTANKAVEFMSISTYAEVIPNDHHLKNTNQSIQLIFNGTNWMKQ
jgi:hypothetical protein